MSLLNEVLGSFKDCVIDYVMRHRAELSLARVLAIYVAGAIAGVQIALYLFDLYDDGIADVRSLLIGLVFVAFGLIFAFRSFRA